MNIEQKIEFLLEKLKSSDCVFLNGVICLFNEHETFEKSEIPEDIYFDDAEGDDFYKSIDIKTIKEIELNNGNFKIIYNNSYVYLSVAKIEQFNFED